MSEAVLLQEPRFRNHDIKSFCSLSILCLCVPGLAPIKAVAILALWSWWVCKRKFRIRSLVISGSILLNLLLWLEWACLYGGNTLDALSQLSRLIMFFMVLSMAGYLVNTPGGWIDRQLLDRAITYIAYIMGLAKLTIVTIVLTGTMTLDGVQDLLGFATVTEDIGSGLIRLQFPSDIVILFLVPCYIGGRSRMADMLVIISLAFVIYLSFSRFLFVGFGIAIFIRSFVLRRFDFASLLVSFLAVAFILILWESFISRFSGEGSLISDDIRREQIVNLSNAISDNALIGRGLGASLYSYIRDETQKYSYEVQWYAMVVQLGFLGLTWFLFNVVLVVATNINIRRYGYGVAAVAALWVISGFTNPFVTSLGSAFGFSLLMLRFPSRDNSNWPKLVAD